MPHLQIPSLWGLGFQRMSLRVHTHSAHIALVERGVLCAQLSPAGSAPASRNLGPCEVPFLVRPAHWGGGLELIGDEG